MNDDQSNFFPLCTVRVDGDDSSGYLASMHDLEFNIFFAAGKGETKALALVDAVQRLINGAGGDLTDVEKTHGTIVMRGKQAPVAGFDTGRAERLIAASDAQ